MPTSTRRYSVILGNLGNTRDRYCHNYKTNPSTLEMLKAAASIPQIQGVELVGTWDISPDNVSEMRAALEDFGLECVSIIPDLFANPIYWRGAFSSREKSVRRQAIDYTKQVCDMARELGCKLINIWPGQDGYDYLLTADYENEREWECAAIRDLAQFHPDLLFALEYKPKEPRTHSYLARMADTLLLAQETGMPNVGVTIDTGHAFVAGEVVAEAVVLAKRAGSRLFHMHFNDNHAYWDDDMIVGTVHSIAYIEMLYWLDRCGYDGWFSMDQYPYREDGPSAITESVQWLIKFDALQKEHKATIDRLVQTGDPIETSRFLRSVLA